MAGLLGDGWDDPQSMATLALAGGLLSPGSLGQGLSRGMQGYQSTMANAQDMQVKKQALQMQQLQFAAALRNQNLINDYLAQGMGQGAAPAPAAAPAAPSAPSQPSVMAGAGAQPAFMSGNPSLGGTAPTAAPSASMPPPAAAPNGMFGGLPASQLVPDLAFNGGKGIAQLVAGYNKPESFRSGGYAMAANGQLTQLPQVPEGFTAVRGQDGAFHIVPVDGGPAAAQVASTAKAAGPAAFKQTEIIGQDGQKYSVFNNALPGFPSVGGSPIGGSAPAAAPAPSGNPNVIPPAVQAARDSDARQIVQNEYDKETDPATKAALGRELARFSGSPSAGSPSAAPAGGVLTGFAPGVITGADNAQNTMTASYKNVQAAAQPAATVQARLDEINKFSKQAILGGDTQWRDSVNNLLQLAGVNDKAADRKTAGDLLDKNASQIALALGTGSQGTDALRSLAAAANPNRKMTQGAIDQAVGQLQASAQVQQAKAQILTPLYNSGNPAAYNSAEQQFDKNADFRVFQLVSDTKGMSAPQIGAYFQAKGYTPAQVKQFQQQKSQLQGLGVQF